jgi:DNA-binding response OmpR family regulator
MNDRNQIILVIEDSPDDVFFLRHALKKAGNSGAVHVVTDGQQALDYLRGIGNYSDRMAFPFPTVVFLDLKLPLVSGFDVLAWIRAQPALNLLPVFILTGSAEERDRAKVRELGAKDYFVKPPQRAMVLQVMETLSRNQPSREKPQ